MRPEQDLGKFDDSARSAILRLQRLAEEAVDIDRLQHQTVAELRERLVPWQDIARALGVTRQAATERFTRYGLGQSEPVDVPPFKDLDGSDI